jgi:hypothetical protein
VHCIALCIALHCIALHCIALHCIALFLPKVPNTKTDARLEAPHIVAQPRLQNTC